MGFWKSFNRYSDYRLSKTLFELLEERSLARKKRKNLTKIMGKDYMRINDVWLRVKDQKRKESFDNWKARLSKCGFDIHGHHLATGTICSAVPLVHAYSFCSSAIADQYESNFDFAEIWERIKNH